MPNFSAAYGNTIAGPTLGAGAHTIGLYLAEDSYAGDVQVTISVNGVQLGGVQAVSALQSNGANELFTLRGDWSGTPTVSVNFLNDAWDGRTGQGHDRNLYVNHVTYDGVAAAADPRVALWNGPVYVSTRPVLRASDFINTIGVGAHLLYADTSYNNESMVSAALNYLGISHVRDGGDVRDPSALAPFERLMAQGISFDFGTLAILDIPTEIARIKTLLAAVPGKIASIEGMNEAAANFSYGGKTGQAAALQLQQDLYTAVKADPALAGIPVLNYTLLSQDPADYTRYGDVSASADLGNVHMYPSGGLTNLASTLLPRELENTAGLSGFVITEAGYDTINNTEMQQAVYVIDTLLDATQAGATTTYLYELLDEKPDPNLTDPEQHFGLFHFDGTPKPAAIAIHTLTTLLADAGASGNWTPQPLAYTVTNLPAIGQSMVFAKSDGSYDIALWAETPLGTETPTTNVTLHLPASAALAIYDLIAGAIPIATYGSATDITLALGADPLIVQVTPPGFSTNTKITATTIGLANDTGLLNSDRITSSAALSGSGNVNATVTISNGPSALGTTTVDSQGHWSFIPSNLADGSYTLSAKETGVVGNTASATLSFLFDTKAPATSISLASDTGVSSFDRITSFRGLIGAGDAGATVTIRKGTTVLGTTTADSAGHWSYSPNGLADGSYTLTATETDTAGNSGTGSIEITLDTIAPKPLLKIITGNSGGGVTLAGTSEANSTVTVTDTSNGQMTTLGTATTGSNGSWSFTSRVVVDVTKSHTYSVSATDAAGNSGAMPGSLYLASTGNETLTSNPKMSDVFAIMSFKGTDIINGFEASSAVGANHDYINFSGRGITSFNQVQSLMSGGTSTVINIGSGKTITLSNIAPSMLTAADFRYS